MLDSVSVICLARDEIIKLYVDACRYILMICAPSGSAFHIPYMRFNFRGVYISRICDFRVFKFAVAGCSGVEISADIRSESIIIP